MKVERPRSESDTDGIKIPRRVQSFKWMDSQEKLSPKNINWKLRKLSTLSFKSNRFPIKDSFVDIFLILLCPVSEYKAGHFLLFHEPVSTWTFLHSATVYCSHIRHHHQSKLWWRWFQTQSHKESKMKMKISVWGKNLVESWENSFVVLLQGENKKMRKEKLIHAMSENSELPLLNQIAVTGVSREIPESTW